MQNEEIITTSSSSLSYMPKYIIPIQTIIEIVNYAADYKSIFTYRLINKEIKDILDKQITLYVYIYIYTYITLIVNE
jgi:hypothetical protein